MNKHIVSMAILSVGLAGSVYAMDEFADMEGFIERQSDEETQRKAEAKRKRRQEVWDRDDFADACREERYDDVQTYLDSHDHIPESQYGIALKQYVTTERMATLLENHGIRFNESDKYGCIVHYACASHCEPDLLRHAIRCYCQQTKRFDINQQRKFDGMTPLHIWAGDALEAFEEKLVQHTSRGLRLDESFKQAGLQAVTADREKLQMLIGAGADCRKTSKYGAMPLDLIEQKRDVKAKFGNTLMVELYEMLIHDLKEAMESKK